MGKRFQCPELLTFYKNLFFVTLPRIQVYNLSASCSLPLSQIGIISDLSFRFCPVCISDFYLLKDKTKLGLADFLPVVLLNLRS